MGGFLGMGGRRGDGVGGEGEEGSGHGVVRARCACAYIASSSVPSPLSLSLSVSHTVSVYLFRPARNKRSCLGPKLIFLLKSSLNLAPHYKNTPFFHLSSDWCFSKGSNGTPGI